MRRSSRTAQPGLSSRRPIPLGDPIELELGAAGRCRIIRHRALLLSLTIDGAFSNAWRKRRKRRRRRERTNKEKRRNGGHLEWLFSVPPFLRSSCSTVPSASSVPPPV